MKNILKKRKTNKEEMAGGNICSRKKYHCLFILLFIATSISACGQEEINDFADNLEEVLEEGAKDIADQATANEDTTDENMADQDKTMTVEEYLEYCTLVTGEDLARNPDDYIGKDIQIEGDFNILAGEIVLDWFTDSGILKIEYDNKAIEENGNIVGNVMTGDHGIVAGRYGGENTWGQRYIDAEIIIITNGTGKNASEKAVTMEENNANANPGNTEENAGTKPDKTEKSEEGNTASSNSQEYIFPDSNSRYLTEEELQNLDANSLRLARNEIFARHGYIFNDEGLKQYFNSTSWYHGTVPSDQFQADHVFNDYETKNVALLNSIEAQAGSEGSESSWFLGKTGVYLNPLPASGTTYKINVLAIGEDTLEFKFGFLENDHEITTETAKILDDHTAQIDFGGLIATFTWTDAEHIYITNDHGYMGGTDSGCITDGTDNVNYEWAAEFN